MIESLPFLISGIAFGLVAGISPGPLLTLVVSETLKHNRKAGIAIAIAPILTDVPIVLASFFVLAKLSNSHFILGVISVSGALFIGYLAYESIAVKAMEANLKEAGKISLRKGVITNFLNPHPYLFWMVVGAPTVLKAYNTNFLSVLLFIFSFYFLLVGSKIFIVLLVDKSKTFLKSTVYLYTIKSLGVVLIILAVLFIRDGLKFFGVF